MTSMDETAPTGRAARLLAVLAVLLGLLAMHAVASAHHAGAYTEGGDLPAAGPGPAHASGLGHEHGTGGQDMQVAQQDTAPAVAAPTVPSCHDDCPNVAPLCVAVLTGAALALLVARRHASPLLLAPAARQTASAPLPPARHARGPDPVRELYVSRT